MEIREYVRTKRRWLVPLVLVPALAGALTGVMIAAQEPESTARVLVQVPPTLSNSDSQIGLYIARFKEGLKLDKVQQQISAQGGVGTKQLAELAVIRQGQSDQFLVGLTTRAGGQRTLAGAEAAAKVGSVWAAEQAAGGTDEALKAAQTAFDEAQKALFVYQDEIRDLDPNVTYSAVTREILSPGNVSTSALRAQQATLIPQVRRFNELKAVMQAASGTLSNAQQAGATQRGQVTAAQTGQQILQSSVLPRPRLVPLIQSSGVAAAVAFLAILGLSLMPDLLRRQRTVPPRPAAKTDGGNLGLCPAPDGSHPTLRDGQTAGLRPNEEDTNGTPLHSSSGSAGS